MSREKHVFSSEELCHVFVHKLQESGYRSDRHMSFQGNEMFSYGWYVIGKHLNKKLDGKPVFLLTRDSYSPSTAKHLSYLRQAISDRDFSIIMVERAGDIFYSIMVLFERIAGAKRKQSRYVNDLKRFDLEADIQGYVADLDILKKLFPEVFTLEQKKELAKVRRALMPESDLKKGLSAYRESLAERAAKRRQAENDRHAALLKEANDAGFMEIWEYREYLRKEEQRENFEKWERGEILECPYLFTHDGDFTRVIIANGEFRTSLGIHMPAQTFRALFERFQAGRIHVDSKVLDFPVREITSEFIRIGCHTLRLSDLEALYKKAV